MFFFQIMYSNSLSIVTATLAVINMCTCANILMITMGGTKSHKIPFWELARGLISRGHNITFINAFSADFLLPGLEEITPAGLVFYVKNFTNWDLVGARMRGEEPVPPLDMIRYGYEVIVIMQSLFCSHIKKIDMSLNVEVNIFKMFCCYQNK